MSDADDILDDDVPARAPEPAPAPEKKRRRWLRWTFGILAGLLVLALLLAAFLWYGVTTERGTKMLFAVARPYIPGTLEIGSQRGPLVGPLELRDVLYKSPSGLEARLARLALDWDARKLFRRQLDITTLQAHGIRIVLPPTEDRDDTEDGKLVDIHLPVNIVVRDALIRDIEVVASPSEAEPGKPAAEPFRLSEIALDAESSRASDVLTVRRLGVVGPTFKLESSGNLTPVGDYAVDLRAWAQYDDPKYPPFVAEGTFRGTLEKLGVDVALAQPFSALVQGDVLTPMRELGMDLRADVKGFEAQKIDPTWPMAVIREGNIAIQGKLDDFKSQGRVDGSYEDMGRGYAIYRVARKGGDFFIEYLNVVEESGAEVNARGLLGTGKDELEMDVVADWQGLQWPLRGGPPVVVSSQGEGKIKGKLSDYRVDVDARLAGPNIPPGRWVVSGRGDLEKMNVRSLRGDVLRGRLAANGSVAWKPQVKWDVKLSGDGLDPAVLYPQYPGRVSFAATTHGTLAEDGPRGRVDLSRLGGTLLGRPLAGNARVDLAGARYDLPSFEIRSGPSRLSGMGTVSTKPRLSWRLRLVGEGVDPAILYPEYPGAVDFAASTSGTMRGDGPYGQVDLDDLGGQLRGNPLDGRVHLVLQGKRYELPRLDLRSGSARVTAQGSFTQAAGDLTWKVAAENLSELLADAGGSVGLEGNISGPWKTPRVRATGGASGLSYQTYAVKALDLTADVDLAPGGRIELDLDATQVGLGERRFDTLALDGEGTRQEHTVTLAVTAPEGALNLALAGGLVGTTDWAGEIRRLDLANEQTGNWGLAGPAGLAAGPAAASLRDFCWISGNARLCAEGSWDKAGPWSASGTLTDLPFALAEPFLPPDLEITGGVSGTFRGQGTPAGVITADVELSPGPGEIRYPAEDGKTASVRFEQGLVRLTAGEGGLTGNADLRFVDAGTLSGELRLPQFNTVGAPLSQQTMAGRIQANFTDLALVEAFVPAVQNPKGTLTADLSLSGTVAVPRASGSVQLAGGQVDVPEYGLELRQIELAAQSDGQGVLQIQGSARSGRGNVTLAGNLPLDERPARLTLKGQRFTVANTRQLKGVVSPDLEVLMELPRVTVTGEVRVPEASISTPQSRRRAAVPVSHDVIIIPPAGELGAEEKKPIELTANVLVVLGGDVSIDAAGFTGRLTGNLRVQERPGRPTAAVGELEVQDGVYQAYGQDLTLERGRLVFAGGPIDNPGLDVRAYRRAEDGTVAGINVTGTVRRPQSTLYSEPPMNESEALAYLLLGRPLGQSTAEEGDLLANAASSLGLKGGNLIAGRLGARFGLQEARIESTGGLEEASLVVGRYLSPRLYVSYGVGLFEPLSTFRIRYILGRRWTLQAEQGVGTSADVLYTVERGRGAPTPVPRRDLTKPVRVPASDGSRPR